MALESFVGQLRVEAIYSPFCCRSEAVDQGTKADPLEIIPRANKPAIRNLFYFYILLVLYEHRDSKL